MLLLNQVPRAGTARGFSSFLKDYPPYTAALEGRIMDRYYLAKAEVQAVAWDGSDEMADALLLMIHCDGGKAEYDPKHKAFTIKIEDTWDFLNPGDWLVQSPPTGFVIWKDYAFKLFYRPVKEAKKD